jgi:uncharacterized protein (DUF2126 family)
VHKLRAEYGQGGFLHFGQGKWYPGEQLPRWALSICWRRRPAGVAQPGPVRRRTRRPPLHQRRRAPVSEALTGKLNLSSQFIQPGYEDVWYYLWRERRLPVNVDPFDSRLDDEMERARLRRVFEQKLDSVVGLRAAPQAQPVAAGPRLAGPVWTTGPWFVRDERCT